MDKRFAQSTAFASADGVVCEMSDGYVGCRVPKAVWPLPADADCGKGMVPGVVLADTVRVDGLCPEVDIARPAVIPAGTGVQLGTVRCLVEEADVSCVRLPHGRGFTVSAEAHLSIPSPAVAGATTRQAGLSLPAGSQAWFESPSGRLACSVTARVVCEVHEPAWTAPGAADACQGAEGDPVPYVELAVDRGTADTACVSDSLAGGPALGYGSTLTVGSLACTSEVTGLTCRNLATAHGFTVSHSRFRGF